MGESPVLKGPLPSAAALFAKLSITKNWSTRVLNEMTDLLLVTSSGGQLVYISPSARVLLGTPPSSILYKHITDVIHPLDIHASSIQRFKCDMSQDAGKENKKTYKMFDVRRRPLIGDYTLLIARPVGDESMDDVVGMKFRYEQLKKEVGEARKELKPHIPQKRLNETFDYNMPNQAISPDKIAEKKDPSSGAFIDPSQAFMSFGPLQPALLNANLMLHPNIANLASWPANINAISSFGDSKTLQKTMTAPDFSVPANHLPSITPSGTSTTEYFLKLRESLDFISQNLEMPGAKPAAPIDSQERNKQDIGNPKKRRVKNIGDHICHECGSTQSPEWRKGPTGAKTLCNACGLRYAKKLKQTEKESSGHTEILA